VSNTSYFYFQNLARAEFHNAYALKFRQSQILKKLLSCIMKSFWQK